MTQHKKKPNYFGIFPHKKSFYIPKILFRPEQPEPDPSPQWSGVVWSSLVWSCLVWYSVVWYGLVWYGLVWYGVVWYGLVGLVWFENQGRMITGSQFSSIPYWYLQSYITSSFLYFINYVIYFIRRISSNSRSLLRLFYELWNFETGDPTTSKTVKYFIPTLDMWTQYRRILIKKACKK